MNTDKEMKEWTSREQLNKLSEQIIGAAFAVSNELGCGFLEKVYENALVHELKTRGLDAEQQKAVRILYNGVLVGEYFADILVAGSVLIELKAAKSFDDVHMAQCLNYLKATGLKLCLLMNFGTPRVEIKRII
jgi:GxxExxY protein